MFRSSKVRTMLVVVAIAAITSTGTGAREITFTVRAGDRVEDLVAEWVGDGITTVILVNQVAAREPFTEHGFIPPPERSMRRFEGLFVPGTYKITVPEGESRYVLTLSIVKHLLRVAGERLSAVQTPPGLSLRDTIILASIVEKEAVSQSSYDLVASVFFNRLSGHIPLCSCPTVEYGLGYHRPFLLHRDLEIDTPYNLYRYSGLPPTPIAFFGNAALQSVIRPADTPLLYFVYDWTNGQLYFAEHNARHQKNAARSRENFRRVFGKGIMYKKFPGVFYNAHCLPERKD